MHAGPFGYPDKTYFDRVTAEFNVRGLNPEDVEDHQVNLKKGTITL